MARADFITSLFLMVLGIGVVVESWRMPRFTEFGTSIWSAPGMVPGMIGGCLALMGAALFVRARAARLAQSGETGKTADTAAGRRAIVAFGLCFVFAALLVGSVPFVVATFLFIFTFIVVFDFQENPGVLRDRKRLIRRVLLAVAVAAAASLVVATIFEKFFFVRLP